MPGMNRTACAGQLALNLRRQVVAAMLTLAVGMPAVALLVLVERPSPQVALALYVGVMVWGLISSVLALVAVPRVLVRPDWRRWALCSASMGLMALPLWWLMALPFPAPGGLGLGLLSGLLLLTLVPAIPASRVLLAAQPGVTVLR